MFRKKGYRIILIVIFLIILTCVSLNIKTYNSRKRTTTQIQNIVKSCVIGDIEKSYINEKYGKKINDCIQMNWMEEGGIKITQIECSTYKENWRENYIWMDVIYKGMLKNGNRVSEREYFKIFFKKNGDKVYIKKVGVSVGETGVSDLDS